MLLNANTRLIVAVKAKKNNNTNTTSLFSLILPLAYADTVLMEPLNKPYLDIVRYSRQFLDISEKKIVDKTLNALHRKYGFNRPFNIEINKTVPTGHGLGSDMSNAAVVIKAFAKYNKQTINVNEYYELGEEIGKDLAYYYYNRPALFSYEERYYKPIKIAIDPYVLLIINNQRINKEELMLELAKEPGDTELDFAPAMSLAENKNLKEFGKCIHNDFSGLILQHCPELQTILDDLAQLKVEAYGIAGASSTIFALSNNKNLLKTIAEKYRKLNHMTIITHLHKEKHKK